MAAGRAPISSSASITAICASPRAPPPPSASAKVFIGAPPPRGRIASAFAASGRTSGAMAAAFSLVAVPSRTRPTMPCRIAASRKKL